jgi:hypothetical protein
LYKHEQVAFIVSCIAASEPLLKDTKIDDWAMAQWDIAALFGAVPTEHPMLGKKHKVNGMPPEIFNRATQVCLRDGAARTREECRPGADSLAHAPH